jgi:hypothetical protein
MLLLTVFDQISGSRRSMLLFSLARKRPKGRKNKLEGRHFAMYGFNFTCKFFIRMSFWQLFLRNYVTREKAAEAMFVRKIRT